MSGDPLGLVGQPVAGYDVVEAMAAYGPRVTYRATHRAWGQTVRLDVLTPDGADPQRADPQRRGFARAGAGVAALASEHAAIVQPRDGGYADTPRGPVAFVVCEWVDGPTVREAFEAAHSSARSHFAPEVVLGWMVPLFDALAAAHKAGIVHAGLDLDALRVRGELGPRAWLKLDGLVEAAWRATLRGGALPLRSPAPGFAAPELASGDSTLVGPWTDVYGMATVIATLTCGSSDPAVVAQRLPDGMRYAYDKARHARIDERFKTMAAFRGSLLEGFEDDEIDSKRNPRRTMVVSDVASDLSEGSAGGFEVDAESDEPRVEVPRRGGVRLAHTIPVMSVPESLRDVPAHRLPQNRPPSGPQPVTSNKGPSAGVVAALVGLVCLVAAAGLAAGYWLFQG